MNSSSSEFSTESERGCERGRYGPITLKLLCAMTNDHTTEILKQHQQCTSKLTYLKNQALKEFSQILDLSPAKASNCFNGFIQRVTGFIQEVFEVIKDLEGNFGMRVYQVSTHAFSQALQQESEMIFEIFKNKVQKLESNQNKEIQSIRNGCQINMKMSLEKQKRSFVSQVEEAVRNKIKQQKQEEAQYLTKLESLESELKLNQTECEVLKDRQRQLLIERSANQSWKTKLEEERDDKMKQIEQFQETLRKQSLQFEEQRKTLQKELFKKQRELTKSRNQITQLKEKLIVEKERSKRLTCDALRRQNQTRSQSADPRETPSDHQSFKRRASKITERRNHEHSDHRRFSEFTPIHRSVRFSELTSDRRSTRFSELTSNRRSTRFSELTSNPRSTRFSEMIPNRRSIKFDEQVDFEPRSGSQDHRKAPDRDRRRMSKLIKGRISFLNPSSSPVDLETSGEVLTAVQGINNHPKSRHSEIL